MDNGVSFSGFGNQNTVANRREILKAQAGC